MVVLEEERLVILSGARPGAVQVCTGPVATAGHLACSFPTSSAQAPMELVRNAEEPRLSTWRLMHRRKQCQNHSCAWLVPS